MNRADASFSFLHRIEEIELNIDDKRWQSALALALTLPDICGGIAFPEIVKKYRDGRVRMDRQNNPTRDVGAQYIQWFNQYAAPYFKLEPKNEKPYISGERCWQLRCEYLHQNKGFLNDENDSEVRFHLGVNCGTSVCQFAGKQMSEEEKDIRIDIQEFCLRMCQAARNYYISAKHEKDFGLYNTPVLDFIQAAQASKIDKRIFIVCKNQAYGNALKMAVQNLVKQVYVFDEAEKGKPDLWIVSQEMLKKEKQPWFFGKKVPVIIVGEEYAIRECLLEAGIETERYTVIQAPVKADILRYKVTSYLKQEENYG